jgi:proline dehydrogenase
MPHAVKKDISALNFENTEVAFRSKSNAELRRSYLLFKTIGYNWLVKTGPALVNFAFNIGLPIKGVIKATVFNQFCGGESINDCNRTMEHLHAYGIGSILDYSVEGKEEEREFEHTMDETIAGIRKAEGNPHIPFCVFKVTGLARFELLAKVNAGDKLDEAEQKEFDRVKARVEKICRTAYECNVRIFIDAEESWIQDAIDFMARDMMISFNKERPIVYNTLQMYRHDRLAFLKVNLNDAIGTGYIPGYKLVRGAYMEKERARAERMGYASPIQPDKASSDRDYDAALHFCMDHIGRMSIVAGTHNEHSSMLLVQLMQEKGLRNDDPRVYFSQLYGMSDHISFNLASKGYNVAKYLPYGPVKAVLPYLFRRAQENTSVKGQAGRELKLISQEMVRRRAVR